MITGQHREVGTLRLLIWAYFALLIFEGSLRKWVLPQLADAFLVIRDPVLLLIYFVALREERFPQHVMLSALYILALFTFLASLCFGHAPLVVMIFGLHTNFLHLPLLFLMAELITEKDLRWFGLACFCVAPPMALLMAIQFISPEDAWVNRGASTGGAQIATALGHIRPAGFFSYNTGATQFWCFCVSFLLDGWTRRQYPLWVLIMAAASVILAVSVSGSRTAVASILIVVTSFVIIAPRAGNIVRTGWILGVIALVLLAVASTGLFKEGLDTLSTRFDEANDAEGSMLDRFLGDFKVSTANTPFFGQGLGLGTNVGAKLTTGEATFLIAEGEWGRVLGESGILFGTAFLLWRVVLAGLLVLRSWVGASTAGPLAWLICSTTGLNFFNGQWGQATTLGFSIFGAGLCLAAARGAKETVIAEAKPENFLPQGELRGRSRYAEALHGRRPPLPTENHLNGRG